MDLPAAVAVIQGQSMLSPARVSAAHSSLFQPCATLENKFIDLFVWFYLIKFTGVLKSFVIDEKHCYSFKEMVKNATA